MTISGQIPIKPERRISVGIPTYNRPEGLKGALQRICGQTYKNLEIIISDNHSSDEISVKKVVEEFSSTDSRIRFYRQTENIGAIRNFKFLLDQANSDYFMWAADDDLLDPTYIEKCVVALEDCPGAVIGITGFEVEDRMQEPVIRKDYTSYLSELPDKETFRRMRNYILQPEYYGKYRVLWGVINRKVLLEAFEEVLGFLKPNERPMWSYLPIDFAVLARGNLAVWPECLFHGTLLPTSDGKKEGNLVDFNQIKLCRKGFSAFGRVIQNSHGLTQSQKLRLRLYLLWEEVYAFSRLLPFQIVQRISPDLARKIKKFWFDTLMRNS